MEGGAQGPPQGAAQGAPAAPPQGNIDPQALAQAVAAAVTTAMAAQQGNGNNLDAQALTQGIATAVTTAMTPLLQQLTTALNTAQGRQPATASTAVTPYEGSAFNMDDRLGKAAFDTGSAPLPTLFDMKPGTLSVFIDQLEARSRKFKFHSGTHTVTRISQNGVDLELFQDWGKILKTSVETA